MKSLRKGRSRRAPRGMTLLIAVAVISVVTAATLVSLRIVSQESELQGRERHSREAFFAAEAGLAEGREVMSLKLSKNVSYTDARRPLTQIMALLGTLNAGKPGYNTYGEVDDSNFPGYAQCWYEVIPTTSYTLQLTKALDTSITTPGQELRDRKGSPFLSFPEQKGVSYHVFVHDDQDEPAPTNCRDDKNDSVWLVSVGEVQDSTGVVLARSVVRALVRAGRASLQANGYAGQRGQGSTKESTTSTSALPNMTLSTQI